MSKSFAVIIDGMIEALRLHVLPTSTDDFVRGQLFSIMFSLNSLKLGADWKAEPLRAQIQLQDSAFDEVKQLRGDIDFLQLPKTPRVGIDSGDSAVLEKLRDDGDRRIGELLIWTAIDTARSTAPTVAKQIEAILRETVRQQLKIELAMTPKSMLNQIATGKE